MKRQAAKLQKACQALELASYEFEFVFVDGTSVSCGKTDPAVAALFPQDTFYEWWNSVENKQGQKKYDGALETMAKMRQYTAEAGPFDVYLGFSQGACLATVLAADAVSRSKRDAAVTPPQMVVLFCGISPAKGAIAGAQEWLPTMDAPLELPSMHILGKEDKAYRRGVELTKLYCPNERHVFEHSGGHRFAKDPWTNAQIAARLALYCAD
jgi:hypothetical protein